jgi:hypothetical protein
MLHRMGDNALSAAINRLERAMAMLEAAASVASKRAGDGGQSDMKLRSEVTAVIDELSQIIGDRRG